MDTIFALATARGRAGVAIVRISGPSARDFVSNLVVDLPKSRGLRVVHDAEGVALDEALILAFDKGASFTGELVIELHLHGSVAVVSAVLKALSDIGLRLADPGEFTRRALENGCLDLAQVEGLADLIDAETEAQRRQALKVMRGSLSVKCEIWRADLLRAVALLEVTIDFADEEVPIGVGPEVLSLIEVTRSDMAAELAGASASERIRDGFEVAIIGRPNVGKSTLLNMLAGREAAITSEVAGTTRDVIEVRMDLNGLPVTLLDTAGIHASDDLVESIGVARAIERAGMADLRVFLLGKSDNPQDLDVIARESDIFVFGKADLDQPAGLAVSGKTGEGVERLLELLGNELDRRAAGGSSAVRERHRVGLSKGILALENAEIHVSNGSEWSELAAEEMRQALRVMDSLVGRVDVESVLDVIFSSFCLGK